MIAINKAKLAGLVLAGSLLLSAPTAALAKNTQVGGAAGVVAAVVQAQDLLNNNTVDVTLIDGSFNNLTALNNVLNNSPILNRNDIDVNVLSVDDVLNNPDIDVTVKNVLTNFLNNNPDMVDAIVGVAVLSGQDLIIFN